MLRLSVLVIFSSSASPIVVYKLVQRLSKEKERTNQESQLIASEGVSRGKEVDRLYITRGLDLIGVDPEKENRGSVDEYRFCIELIVSSLSPLNLFR